MTIAGMVAGGVRLVRTQPKAVAMWGGLYLVAMAAMLALVWPAFADVAQWQQQAALARLQTAAPPMPPGGFFAAILLFDLVLLLVIVAIFAAAVRATAVGGEDRFGFLRFGADELRLIGLTFLLWLIAVAAMVVLILLLVLLGVGAALLVGQSSLIGFTLLIQVVLFALIVWAEVRISLAGALTVLRGRIVIKDAWRLTRGRFWPLFGFYLLASVAYAIVGIVLIAILNPGLFSVYTSAFQPRNPEAIVAMQQAVMANLFGPRMIVMWLLGAAINAVALAFIFGAIATAAIDLEREAVPERS